MNWDYLFIRPKMDEEGFTLLEIVAVLIIISVMAAVIVPNYFKSIEEERENATRKEMQAIYSAIVGDPELGNYGYLGDMGALPGSLADLNTQGGAPDYDSSNSMNGIGMGWNGPYVNMGFDAVYTQDAWLNSYIYSTSTGQITSKGTDGTLDTNDDITIPPNAVNTTGDISVKVTAADYFIPGSTKVLDDSYATVRVYYSNNGTEANALADWSAGIQAFTTLGWATHPHRGVHALEASGLGSYAPRRATANATVLRGTTAITIFIE